MDREHALSNVALFSKLDPKHIKGISQICTERTFAAGEYLMKQGETGIGLYMLMSGKVKIEKTTPDGKKVEIAENGPGDILGEMAVIDGSPRSASVVAKEATTCLLLASWEFNAFLKAHPEAALAILPIVVARFRETNDALIGLRSVQA